MRFLLTHSVVPDAQELLVVLLDGLCHAKAGEGDKGDPDALGVQAALLLFYPILEAAWI